MRRCADPDAIVHAAAERDCERDVATASATATLPPSGSSLRGDTTPRRRAGAGRHAARQRAERDDDRHHRRGRPVPLADVPTADLLVQAEGGGAVGAAISALDATYVLQAVAQLRTLSPEQALACDVTGNGSLSTVDATLLLQRAPWAYRRRSR
ncbi:MAG: dockerin type I repeat-containing protein [Candidatus Binatia bacterium]